MKRLIIFIAILFLTICTFGQMKITSGSVNLRSSPEIKNNIVCKIPKGTVVSIVNDSVKYKNWTKVNFSGKLGYVYSTYIHDVPASSKYDNNTSSENKEVKYYKNSQGEKVQSPTYYNSPPSGATAECNDGTYSFSKNHKGTCSHHGGVKRWLK